MSKRLNFWRRREVDAADLDAAREQIQVVSSQSVYSPLIPLQSPATWVYSSLSPVSDALAHAHSEIKQLKFLLASAPMMDVPTEKERMQASRSPFAYVNPKSMAGMLRSFESQRVPRGFMIFPGSPTKWVLTSLMPEGRVIYSPLPIPGLEKILAQ